MKTFLLSLIQQLEYSS